MQLLLFAFTLMLADLGHQHFSQAAPIDNDERYSWTWSTSTPPDAAAAAASPYDIFDQPFFSDPVFERAFDFFQHEHDDDHQHDSDYGLVYDNGWHRTGASSSHDEAPPPPVRVVFHIVSAAESSDVHQDAPANHGAASRHAVTSATTRGYDDE